MNLKYIALIIAIPDVYGSRLRGGDLSSDLDDTPQSVSRRELRQMPGNKRGERRGGRGGNNRDGMKRDGWHWTGPGPKPGPYGGYHPYYPYSGGGYHHGPYGPYNPHPYPSGGGGGYCGGGMWC